MRNTKKGFTLVELLVVIAILAILATVSVVGYTNYIKNANESLALQELSQVKSSILAEDIVNNNFAIGSDGKVNAEGEAKFNEYLAGLATDLNGELLYADGKVTYTLKKDTSVVYVLDLKTGEVEAGTATQTPVTPPAGGEEGGETPVEPEPTPDPDPEPETPAEPTTVTVSISDYATENSWGISVGNTNNGNHTEVKVGDVTVTLTYDGSNSGKCFDEDGTKQWRIYQTESPSLKVAAPEGKTIVSVKFTYNVSNTGVLTSGGTNISSGTEVSVNANSITFGVGNTGTKTNGQVRITSIEVTYQ